MIRLVTLLITASLPLIFAYQAQAISDLTASHQLFPELNSAYQCHPVSQFKFWSLIGLEFSVMLIALYNLPAARKHIGIYVISGLVFQVTVMSPNCEANLKPLLLGIFFEVLSFVKLLWVTYHGAAMSQAIAVSFRESLNNFRLFLLKPMRRHTQLY